MEKVPDLKLPNELCQQIFNNEFEIDIGNVNEEIISKTIELYVVINRNNLSKRCSFSQIRYQCTPNTLNLT